MDVAGLVQSFDDDLWNRGDDPALPAVLATDLLPATGRRFAHDGAAFFTAVGDRLAEAWVLGDLAGLRAQLTDGPD